jgi:hypothetical protein
MPCTCDGYDEPEPNVHNGKVAEMLCEIMWDHEQRDEMSCFSKDQLDWWREHKKRDRDRVRRDISRVRGSLARRNAIAALSHYEYMLFTERN